MKICPNCQTQCSDDAIFCPKCGSDIPAAPAQEAAPQTPAFCPKCGKQLEPGTTFCPGCGARLDGKKSGGQSPAFIAETLGTVKCYATGKPVEAVEKAAKSKGLSWIIFAALAIISFMFAVPTNIRTALNRVSRAAMLKAYREFVGGSLDSDSRKALRDSAHDFASGYSWGFGLLWNFLIGTLAFFGTCIAFYLVVKVFLKKDVHFFNVFNAVGAASIPLTCAFVLNIVFGLVWWPLTVLFFGCGAIASLILLYKGFCSLATFEKKPVMAFICAMILVFIPVCIVAGIIADVQSINFLYGGNL